MHFNEKILVAAVPLNFWRGEEEVNRKHSCQLESIHVNEMILVAAVPLSFRRGAGGEVFWPGVRSYGEVL
jgi:hypothetical protein